MYWLLKTEPGAFSYPQLENEKTSVWDGVTNAMAQKHMRSAKKGERAVLYHTGTERAAVGIVELVSDPYPDPKTPELCVFDIAPRKRLELPVPLAAIKASRLFADSPLVKMGRLSVVPLEERQWRWLLATGKTSD